jgi:hypothetical protein
VAEHHLPATGLPPEHEGAGAAGYILMLSGSKISVTGGDTQRMVHTSTGGRSPTRSAGIEHRCLTAAVAAQSAGLVLGVVPLAMCSEARCDVVTAPRRAARDGDRRGPTSPTADPGGSPLGTVIVQSRRSLGLLRGRSVPFGFGPTRRAVVQIRPSWSSLVRSGGLPRVAP